MKATELQDEAMDMVVGGSSYKSDLSGFIHKSATGVDSFQYSTSSSSVKGHIACPVSDRGMAGLIRMAERDGKVTLTSTSGVSKDFTAKELSAML